MLLKSGDVQPENNERLGGEVKDVFQSQKGFCGGAAGVGGILVL